MSYDYQTLQADMVALSHRKDLTSKTAGFIEQARKRINQRLGLELAPLVDPTDTNEVLDENSLIYFYPAMKALYEFIVELETATYYEGLFQQEADGYYVKAKGTTPLVIKPECPAP